jgi:hypothetical protein
LVPDICKSLRFLKADGRTAGDSALMAEGSLFFDFYTRPVSPKLLLANRLRGAATGENLKRILSETKLGVNRWEKILKVIGRSQVDIIIAEPTTSHPEGPASQVGRF